MHFFEFVLLVVIVASIAKLIEKRMDHKAARPAPADADEEPGELARRLEQLEERIRVLERIVTDQRGELHRQFRDLGH